jgi:hypothetical protein
MPEITLKLPDAFYTRVASIYGEDAINEFSLTAVEELVSWLSAEERPSTISELETKRIYLVYTRILKDLLPTAEDICQSFNLPMGRSRYIVQNINYRHPGFMKRRRVTTIIAALQCNQVSEDGLPIAIIPKECDEYLYAVTTELYINHLITTVPKRIRLLESIRFEFGVSDKNPLLDRLNEDLSKLPEESKG